MKNPLKKITVLCAKTIAGFLVFLLVLMLLAAVGAQTFIFWLNSDPGNRWLVERLNATLDETGYALSLNNFRVSIPSGFEVQSFELALGDEKLIAGEELSLEIDLDSIARKHLAVTLVATNLNMENLPASSSKKQNGGDAPFLKKNVPYFKTAQLNVRVETLELSKTILNSGLKAQVNLHQNLAFNDDQIDMQGHLKIATDSLENPITFKASIDGAVDNFCVTADLAARYQDKPVAITAKISRQKNTLRLYDISSAGTAIDIKGAFTCDMKTALAEGQLNVTLPDSKIIDQITNNDTTLAAATAHLNLSATNNVQAMLLEGTLSGLRYRDYGAQTACVSIKADNVRDMETLGADIVFLGCRIASVDIETASATFWFQDDCCHATVSGNAYGDSQKLSGQFSLPLGLSLLPFDFDIDKEALVHGYLQLQSDIQVLAEPFLYEGCTIKGSLNTETLISGRLSAPKLNGTVHLDNGLFADTSNQIQLTEITAIATLNNKSVKLQSLTAKDSQKKGTLTLSGEFDFADFTHIAMEAALQMENMHLVQHENYDAWLNADITLHTEADGYRISGTLSPQDVSIRIPDRFGENIPQLNIISQDKPEKPTDDLFARTKLDLQFMADNQIFVSGHGLTAELKGLLDVRGSLKTPLVQGTLETVRGRYEEFGRRFLLDRAMRRFQGPVPPSPYLDIEASTTVDDITGLIRITNSIEEPEIKLSSTPALPEDEVLSFILFGKNIQKISPFQAVQLANALRKFSGKGGASGFDPLYDLQTLTGLDDIRIETVSAEGATVGAGKYISDTVYLEVKQGTQSGSSEASIEVELTPMIFLESKVTYNAENDIGLFWEWEYGKKRDKNP